MIRKILEDTIEQSIASFKYNKEMLNNAKNKIV